MENQALNKQAWQKDKVSPQIAEFEELFAGEDFFNRLFDRLKEAASLLDRGSERRESGDRTGSIADLDSAMLLIGEFFLTLGKHLVEAGSWQRGIWGLRYARDAFSKIDNWQGQARASVEIGDAHLLLGDYEVAQMSYLDAQRYLRKIGNEAGLAVTWQKLGTLALFMYQADEAEKQLKDAITFFDSHGDQKRAEISRQLLQLAPEIRQEIPV